MTDSANKNLATAGDVRAALTALGLFTPDIKTLAAIASVCRDDFLSSIASCIAGQDTGDIKRKSLEGLLGVLTPEVVASLKNLGHSPELTVLVRLGQKMPTRFISALAAAKDSAHPRHGDAKAYLDQVLATPNTTEGSSPASKSPAARNAAAAQDTPIHSEQAPAENASQNSGSYCSQHVYGADYALCFNAGTGQDGKPGIMVDAAVATGPKAYDWKHAIHIWLDAREVGCALAVFRKRRESVEFAGHGKLNDKAFSLAFQGSHFYCRVRARQEKQHPVRGVKILPQDAIAVSVIFLQQLLLAYPHVPADEVLALAMSVNEVAAVQST